MEGMISSSWSSLVAQWVKDPALSLQWLCSLLWRRFSPWPRNFHMPWAWLKKKIPSSLVVGVFVFLEVEI